MVMRNITFFFAKRNFRKRRKGGSKPKFNIILGRNVDAENVEEKYGFKLSKMLHLNFFGVYL